jgi:hypothetical protein
MPSLQAYTFRMPAGFAGDLQRAEIATIETQQINSSAPPTSFGVAIKLVGGLVTPINASTDTSANVYGVNLRPYPIQGNGTDPLGTSTPPTSGVVDVLRRGYVDVVLNGTTAAAKGGTVYVRVANVSAGKPLGGFEAAAELVGTAGANTGNGTMSAISASTSMQNGSYLVKFTAATAFNVTAPNGVSMPAGVTGTAYVDNQINFTITAGGTAFVAGDTFTISQNTFALPANWNFTGPADAYGITEIAVNI